MTLHWIGLVAAIATFTGVWLGHVTVRKVEYISSTVWLPSLVALLLGLSLEYVALLSADDTLSAALGIFGITLMWDALEFWRQHRRVEKGHAPANPDNPRHARLLAESGSATTVDWLKREPAGSQLSADELRKMQEGSP